MLKPVVKFQQFPIAERATLLHYQRHAPQSPIENSKPISLFGKSLPFHHSKQQTMYDHIHYLHLKGLSQQENQREWGS